MLSILIPVYNYNITKLVFNLHKQASKDCVFEILVADDCSLEEWKSKNRIINDLPNTKYIELPQNVGRAKIRNLLAQEAKHKNLLFLDCDAEVPSSNFIKNYIPFFLEDSITCGGTSYTKETPQKEYFLRWYYGKKREEKSALVRNENPNKSFTTFNFVISKNIFNKVTFNESIKMYGHEDTLFGIELKNKGYSTIHIDNPLIHLGLDTNEVFLLKTKQSVESLFLLLKEPNIPKEFYDEVRLLNMYAKIKKFYLTGIVSFVFSITENAIEKNLTHKKPSLLLFDFYKLGYLIRLMK